MRHDDIVPAWEALGTRLDVDGANSRIWREGKGEPVVCLHGVPASSFVYRKLLPELATRGMEGIAFDFQLLEQTLEHVAFASFSGNHVPQVANLGLPNPVDAAESLFKAVRVPRQVIVDHQVRVLKVHAFTGSIGRQEYSRGWVVAEQLLNLAALFTLHAAVDHHDGFLAAD